jgi:hypothetical protein
MITFDMSDFEKQMRNAMSYAEGFFDGVDVSHTLFNNELAQVIKQACGKYIDSSARIDPTSLHHVYEWGAVGDPGGRLFDITALADNMFIRFTFDFRDSNVNSPGSATPFAKKAEIMESGMSVVVAPKNSDTLVFEGDDGEMVFTQEEITIENPGGPNTTGSFERVVREFFYVYLKQGLLKSLLKDLDTADEFTDGFKNGTGYGRGMIQGKRYLTVDGGVM